VWRSVAWGPVCWKFRQGRGGFGMRVVGGPDWDRSYLWNKGCCELGR
jgi:hypothetical protein